MATNNMDDKPKAKYNSVKDVPLTSVQDRVQPRQVGTGVMRGSQTIVNPTDSSKIVMGKQPDNSGDFGIGFFNSSADITAKYLGTVDVKYREDGTGYFINGELPDGTRGLVISKDGTDVFDVFD